MQSLFPGQIVEWQDSEVEDADESEIAESADDAEGDADGLELEADT